MNISQMHKPFSPLNMVLVLLCSFLYFAPIAPSFAEPDAIRTNESQKPPIQKPASQQPTTVDTITTWIATIEQYEKALQREGISASEIDNIIAEATKVQTKALSFEQKLRPQLTAINANIAALGSPPKEGDADESDEIKTLRKELTQTQQLIDNKLKYIQLAKSKSSQLILAFNDSRRIRLLDETLQQSQSALNPLLWADFFTYFDQYINSINLFFNDSIQRLFSDSEADGEGNSEFWIFILLYLMVISVGIIIIYLLARFVHNFLLKRRINDRAKSSIKALFSAIKQILLPLVIIAAITATVNFSSISNTAMAKVANAIDNAFALGLALFGFSHIFINPKNQQRRLLQISTPAAKGIFSLMCVAALNLFSHQFIIHSNLVNAFPLGLKTGFDVIFAAITVIICATVLYMITKDHREQDTVPSASQGLINWRLGRPLLWGLTLTTLIALVLGYINLAEFTASLINNIVIISAFFWLLLEIIDHALSPLFHQNSSFTRDLANFFGIKHTRVRQAGIILAGLLRIAVILVFFALLAFNFGFQTSDWFIWLSRAFFGFSIGNIVISPATILTVIVIAFLGFAATKAIQNWLGHQYLPNTELDHGVQNSISTVFGYTGTIMVCLFAATYAGLNFQNLAIIFGALSVGIGFGLQSIVGNFVSGLILLAERPIKVGDWIITSGGEGTVRNISVRSTQIETFDRSTIVVPNQTLITEPVTNWTYRNELGRIKVLIGTDYNSDPEQVRDILIKCAKDHEGILNYPEPHVLFVNMGPDALEFELRAYLKEIGNGALVRSDLRFAILKELREAKINIPFPQRHVHIEGLEELVKSKKKDEE